MIRRTHCAEGMKSPLDPVVPAGWLLILLILFTREPNTGAPTGCFPLAFSDIPRNCSGTASSTEEETEAVRELWFETDDCEGVGCWSCSSLSESSSPIAKSPLSSGTPLSDGVLALSGLLKLSTEPLREDRTGLDTCSDPSESLRS